MVRSLNSGWFINAASVQYLIENYLSYSYEAELRWDWEIDSTFLKLFHFDEYHWSNRESFTHFALATSSACTDANFTWCNACPLLDLSRVEVNLRAIFTSCQLVRYSHVGCHSPLAHWELSLTITVDGRVNGSTRRKLLEKSFLSFEFSKDFLQKKNQSITRCQMWNLIC